MTIVVAPHAYALSEMCARLSLFKENTRPFVFTLLSPLIDWHFASLALHLQQNPLTPLLSIRLYVKRKDERTEHNQTDSDN
jgi:hypothetical protein